MAWTKGDYALCVDNKSKPEWAKYLMDNAYSEDMLEIGRTYIVLGVNSRDGHTGLNVGVPTPWGDEDWDAVRFRKTLLAPVMRWDEKRVKVD